MANAGHTFVQEWHDTTVIHPLGLAALLVCGIALLTVRRRYATWPLLIMACFVASAQRITVAGADFDLLRILLLCGSARVLLRGEYRHFRWNRLDATLVAWAILAAFIPIAREGTDLLLNRLGHLYDALGFYFLSRCLFADWDDALGLQRALTFICFPVAATFAIEWLTARNFFAIFGGLPEVTSIRDGRLRCQGAFAHPILAGCFWAAALPLVATQWWRGRRTLSVTGSAAGLLIIFACASATPLIGAITCAAGGLLYAAKRYLWAIRWAIAAALIGLHMVMNAPVWHLIARTSALGGSSWHRFALIDGAIRHLHEWWLLGSRVGTAHWGHFTFDVTNYYIAQAVHGGLLLLTLFICIIYAGFSIVGSTLRISALPLSHKTHIWALGVSLLVHAVNHFGVSYFGQIWLLWYFVLGCIGSLPTILRNAHSPARFATEASSPPIIYLSRYGTAP